MGQFPSHGNKAANGNGFGTPGLIDLGRSDQPGRLDPQGFQALAKHFAALPERGGGHLFQCTAVAGLRGVRGTNRTTEEVTLGCGTKAAGEISNRILVSARQFASTPSRP